jgi:hypothetical protein
VTLRKTGGVLELAVWQARHAFVGVPTQSMQRQVTLLQAEGKTLFVNKSMAFDGADALCLALMLHYDHEMDQFEACRILRSRHKSGSKGDVQQLRALHAAGVLHEVLAKEDLPKAISFIEELEQDERERKQGRITSDKHVKATYPDAIKARNANLVRSARAVIPSGRPVGSSGSAASSASSASNARRFVATTTVAKPGVETVISQLQPDGAAITINNTNGCFVATYEGDYLKSFSWYMRNSTSVALRLALMETWREHTERYRIPLDRATRVKIEKLYISRLNMQS